MASNGILNTKLPTDIGASEEDDDDSTVEYLIKDNYLSEFETEAEKETARNNLGVYSTDVIQTYMTELETSNAEIAKAITDHLNDTDDPHNTLVSVATMLEEYVKADGTVPFTSVQTGVTPSSSDDDTALVTKEYVATQLTDLLDSDDKQDILDTIETELTNYAKKTDVYDTDEAYSSDEIDDLLKDYVKKDGTIPFTAPQIGKDPTLDSHLATKRYADKLLYKHMVEVDPHDFITTLNNRLASYAKSKDVYTKSQTYSRSQIDSLINSAVEDSIDSALESYQNSVDEQLEELDTFIKKDGSRVFTAPQQGVAATQANELVTLEQVEGLIDDASEEINETIDDLDAIWVTSGPVESTVGHVVDNSELPEEMTLQQIMDAIFYGNTVSISADEYVTIGTTTTLTLCVHGSTANITSADLYQGDTLIASYSGDDFEDGCIEVESEEITEETEFRFVVSYSTGVENEQTITVGVSYPVFIGLLPKWKTASTITMEYLEELANEDSTNNQFVDYNGDGSSITFTYDFEDAELRHIFIVVPQSYPDLESITTSTQEFDIDAFDVVEDVQLVIESIDGTAVFKIYVYSQALSSLSQEVTFNFASTDEDEDTEEDTDEEDETEEEEE